MLEEDVEDVNVDDMLVHDVEVEYVDVEELLIEEARYLTRMWKWKMWVKDVLSELKRWLCCSHLSLSKRLGGEDVLLDVVVADEVDVDVVLEEDEDVEPQIVVLQLVVEVQEGEDVDIARKETSFAWK